MQEQKAEYENKLKAKLGENEAVGTENYTIYWKTYNMKRFANKRFAREHPDLYQKYVKETTSRRFSVK